MKAVYCMICLLLCSSLVYAESATVDRVPSQYLPASDPLQKVPDFVYSPEYSPPAPETAEEAVLTAIEKEETLPKQQLPDWVLEEVLEAAPPSEQTEPLPLVTEPLKEASSPVLIQSNPTLAEPIAQQPTVEQSIVEQPIVQQPVVQQPALTDTSRPIWAWLIECLLLFSNAILLWMLIRLKKNYRNIASITAPPTSGADVELTSEATTDVVFPPSSDTNANVISETKGEVSPSTSDADAKVISETKADIVSLSPPDADVKVISETKVDTVSPSLPDTDVKATSETKIDAIEQADIRQPVESVSSGTISEPSEIMTIVEVNQDPLSNLEALLASDDTQQSSEVEDDPFLKMMHFETILKRILENDPEILEKVKNDPNLQADSDLKIWIEAYEKKQPPPAT